MVYYILDFIFVVLAISYYNTVVIKLSAEMGQKERKKT